MRRSLGSPNCCWRQKRRGDRLSIAQLLWRKSNPLGFSYSLIQLNGAQHQLSKLAQSAQRIPVKMPRPDIRYAQSAYAVTIGQNDRRVAAISYRMRSQDTAHTDGSGRSLFDLPNAAYCQTTTPEWLNRSNTVG